MAETQPNETKNNERSTTYDKKIANGGLVILFIIGLAIVVSMFNTSKAPKEPPKIDGHAEEMIPPTDFSKQIKFEESQLSAARLHHTNDETAGDVGDDDSDWDKKEKVRALDARKSTFGLENSANTDSKNEVHAQIERAALLPVMPTRPAANIVGREVDNSYAGKVQGEKLLVPTGTVIDGVLDRDIISDYPGAWEGHTIQDIYSIDNQFILAPKGTKIMGQSLHIGNVNEPIQNRMGMTVEWAVLPNGKRIDFHKNTPMDIAGVPAFEGEVNRHFMAQFLSVTAYALISAEAPRDNPNQYGSVQPTFQGQFADSYRGAMLPFVMKYLSLVPTVTLKAGMPIKIHTQDDMYLKPWSRVNTTIYSTEN
ncbi:MAG: TrbI/VirB10 family protein [Gammaproteobacteria bacterium]